MSLKAWSKCSVFAVIPLPCYWNYELLVNYGIYTTLIVKLQNMHSSDIILTQEV